MNLEDHLGDIVRKGRTAAGASAADAANAAGISESASIFTEMPVFRGFPRCAL